MVLFILSFRKRVCMKHRHIERAGVFSWNRWAGVVREWVCFCVGFSVVAHKKGLNIGEG